MAQASESIAKIDLQSLNILKNKYMQQNRRFSSDLLSSYSFQRKFALPAVCKKWPNEKKVFYLFFLKETSCARTSNCWIYVFFRLYSACYSQDEPQY